MLEVACKHPGGKVILATGGSPRYMSFYQDLMCLRVPQGTELLWLPSNSVAQATNTMLQHAADENQWAWIIGDDHTFPNDIIFRLLDREEDAVLPLCLTRHAPFGPTVWMRKDREIYMPTLDEMPTSGVVPIWSAGDAGLLIKPHVIRDTGPPWYDLLLTSVKSEVSRKGEDFYLCKQIRKKGYKLCVDMDNRIGHTIAATLIPVLGKDGKWRRAIMEGNRWIGYVTYTRDQYMKERQDKGEALYHRVEGKDLE